MQSLKHLIGFGFVCLVASSGSESYGHQHADYFSYPKYNFDYGVHDAHTGDQKKQWETRDGDVVKGGYQFHEADGRIRVVEYYSDKHGGFNAVVKHIGHGSHPHIHGNGHGHTGGGLGHYSDNGHGHATSYANYNLHLH